MAWHGMALLHFGANFPTDHRVCTFSIQCIKLGLHTSRKIFLKVICIGAVHLCSQVGPWIGIIFSLLSLECCGNKILTSCHDIKKIHKINLI